MSCNNKPLRHLFDSEIEVDGNFISREKVGTDAANQLQTEDAFSDKWSKVDEMDSRSRLFETQREWFLELYGFGTEDRLAEFLSKKHVILDAGCGLGYKAAWFADLSPGSIVIGIDISEAAEIAARNYASTPNLYFLRADIASTGLRSRSADFVVCDQVIMHTEVPEDTFRHLAEITSDTGQFACYVYAKKALPRELVDDHFRQRTHEVSSDEMWEFAAQLTELGKRLSALNVTFEAPDIPLIGIKGGAYDIQRFLYWNFLKCFWKEGWGEEMCNATNYDWYAPSNARRFSQAEFEAMAVENGLQTVFFHSEEACYSGRFARTQNAT